MVADEQARQHGVGPEPLIIELGGAFDGFIEEQLGPGELAGLHQRLAEIGEQGEPCRIRLR